METFENITKDNLEYLYLEKGLSDSEIAEKFGVKKYTVTKKRCDFDIKYKDMGLYHLRNHPEDPDVQMLNQEAKERLLKRENIDSISRAITHFVFRNGPIETMHADQDKNLLDKDMKILNKFMVNRVSALLTLIADNRWAELEVLYKTQKRYGIYWDKAEPDIKAIIDIVNIVLR